MFYHFYWVLVVALLSFSPLSFAFSFSAEAATECDSLSISWSGGTAPFSLHLLPVFGTPRNIQIPATAFSDGKGSFSLPQLPMPREQQYMLSMSDSTGFGTGGTTNVLTVGASKGGSCNSTDPGIDFPFQLNTALTQCRPYIFSGYSTAAQPVTIIGLIPSGTPFVLNPPPGATQFSWTANVEHGTSIVFMMIDALGRQGGTSDVRVVGVSDDRSCLNGLSPSSTSASVPTTSASRPSTTGSTTTSAAPSASSTGAAPGGTPIGAIAGTVIGGLLFLAVVITLGLFFLRKRKDAERPLSFRRQSRPMGSDLQYEPYGGAHDAHPYSLSSGAAAAYAASPSPNTPQTYNPQAYASHPYGHTYQQSTHAPSTYAPSTHHPTLSGGAYDGYSGSMLPYESNPFQDGPQQQYPTANYPYQSTYQLPSASAYALPNSADPFNPVMSSREQPLPPPPPLTAADDPFASSENMSTSDSTMSAQQRKAAMAGVAPYKPSRIVVHTDADDVLPPPNADGVVELPPQYTERRGLTVVNQSPPSPSPSTTRFPPTHPPS